MRKSVKSTPPHVAAIERVPANRSSVRSTFPRDRQFRLNICVRGRKMLLQASLHKRRRVLAVRPKRRREKEIGLWRQNNAAVAPARQTADVKRKRVLLALEKHLYFLCSQPAGSVIHIYPRAVCITLCDAWRYGSLSHAGMELPRQRQVAIQRRRLLQMRKALTKRHVEGQETLHAERVGTVLDDAQPVAALRIPVHCRRGRGSGCMMPRGA